MATEQQMQVFPPTPLCKSGEFVRSETDSDESNHLRDISKPNGWWNFWLQGTSRSQLLLLSLSFMGMLVGYTAGSLLLRFYFVNGGSRKWLSTWIQTAGWPLCAIATGIIYWKNDQKLTSFTPRLCLAYLLLGGLLAVDNFMYVWGISYLSASTAGLLSSSQLVFNAIFALILNRQKISSFGYNAIVLVISSAIILALHSDSDKPPGVTKSQYTIGYIMIIASAALYGFIFPLTELVFKKVANGTSNYVILEMQVFVSLVATAFAMLGMAINHDFTAISIESKNFKPGQASYYLSLFWTAASWQVGFLGSTGLIYLSSSLLAGITLAAMIPCAAIFAIIFFHDSFSGLKVMAMILSLWGFTSYIYGGYLETKSEAKMSKALETVHSAADAA